MRQSSHCIKIHQEDDKNRRNVTINLQAIVRSSAAAGHSGQKSTVKRSEMRLSKIALYSASFEFFVVFVLPDR